MLKRLLTTLTLLFSLAAFADSLRAETVSYPEKDPAFTLETPDGWKTKSENGAIMIGGSSDAAVLLQHVSDVKDETSAKAGLPKLAAAAAKTFNMKDAKEVTPVSAAEIGEFEGFATEYKGKDKDGEDAFWQLMIFAPKENDYYLVTVVCSDKDDKKTAADRDAIVKSLKAADSD